MPDAVGSERDEVIGREPELAAIERFLEPRTWPRALQLEGDPGIGKTTLWAACGSARARGITVLGGRRPGPVTVRDRLVAFVPVSFVA